MMTSVWPPVPPWSVALSSVNKYSSSRACSQVTIGTATFWNLVPTFPEPTVEELTITTFRSASLVWEAASPTATTSNPNTDSKRALTAASLGFKAAGLATTNSAFGKELSAVKFQELVRVSTGEPSSLNTSVALLPDRTGRAPGRVALMVVTPDACATVAGRAEPFKSN